MGTARARAWLRALRRSRTTGDRPNSLMPQRASSLLVVDPGEILRDRIVEGQLILSAELRSALVVLSIVAPR